MYTCLICCLWFWQLVEVAALLLGFSLPWLQLVLLMMTTYQRGKICVGICDEYCEEWIEHPDPREYMLCYADCMEACVPRLNELQTLGHPTTFMKTNLVHGINTRRKIFKLVTFVL